MKPFKPSDMDILGIHAVGLVYAAELLAGTDDEAAITEKLRLIILESRARYWAMSNQELKTNLDKTSAILREIGKGGGG
jgi:hypothetical protein